MAAFRTARSAVALAAATLLTAVSVLLALSGTAHAVDRNCDSFTYQEDAQAALAANPADPNNLDSNDNGVACETRPHRPAAGTSADETTSTTETATTTTQPAALVAADSSTTVTTDAITTDSTTATSTTTATDTPSATSTTTTDTTTTTSDSDDSSSDSDSDDSSSSTSSGDDKDCADFASQADAQAALDAELSDPDNLDADVDGIACEQHFGAPGQQVQVYPTGGVDTGGEPADV